MKKRSDYVTNSSSSSFIISNKTNESMTSKDVVEKVMEKVMQDAEDRFTIEPGKSIVIECGDNRDDGAFENFIHEMFSLYHPPFLESEDVQIQFHKSHH